MTQYTFSTAPLDTRLWGVYGPDCAPTMICCIVSEAAGPRYRAVWGYSVFERVPGFRTLGVGKDWADEHNLGLWDTQSEALMEVARLTSPRLGVKP